MAVPLPLVAINRAFGQRDLLVNQHRHVTPPGHHINPLTERAEKRTGGVPFGADRDPTFEADPLSIVKELGRTWSAVGLLARWPRKAAGIEASAFEPPAKQVETG